MTETGQASAACMTASRSAAVTALRTWAVPSGPISKMAGQVDAQKSAADAAGLDVNLHGKTSFFYGNERSMLFSLKIMHIAMGTGVDFPICSPYNC